jgi:hypothetical protein
MAKQLPELPHVQQPGSCPRPCPARSRALQHVEDDFAFGMAVFLKIQRLRTIA